MDGERIKIDLIGKVKIFINLNDKCLLRNSKEGKIVRAYVECDDFITDISSENFRAKAYSQKPILKKPLKIPIWISELAKITQE